MHNDYRNKKTGGKKSNQEERFAAVLALHWSMCAPPCHELTEAAAPLMWPQQLSWPFQLQLWKVRSAPGLASQRKAEASWHNGVWSIDCSMTENFPIHQKVVNVKPCHTHPFPFLWLLPSFSLLFFLFQNRELAGLWRVSLSTASPVFCNWRKQSWREREAGVRLIRYRSSEMPQTSESGSPCVSSTLGGNSTAKMTARKVASLQDRVALILCLVSADTWSAVQHWKAKLIPWPVVILVLAEEAVSWEPEGK